MEAIGAAEAELRLEMRAVCPDGHTVSDVMSFCPVCLAAVRPGQRVFVANLTEQGEQVAL